MLGMLRCERCSYCECCDYYACRECFACCVVDVSHYVNGGNVALLMLLLLRCECCDVCVANIGIVVTFAL